MNDHKLYSVIGGSFRTTLRAALISRLYPYVGSDIVTANPLTVVSASMQDAIVDEVIESVNVSSLGIISGSLDTFEFPVNQLFVNISTLGIISGELSVVIVSPSTPTTDIVNISPLGIISGTLDVVTISADAPIEMVNISNLSIISGSLL